MAQASGYQLPEGFTVSKPEGWPSWTRRFERFREASDLNEKSEQKQVSSLIFAMGDEAEDTLDSFRLSDDERKSYSTVRDKFEVYLVKKRNIVLTEQVSFKEDEKRESQLHLFSMTYMPWPNIATLVSYMMNWSEIYW